MTQVFNNLKNMYSSVVAVILYYAAVWTGYVPFETANTNFNNTVGDIEDAEEIQKIIIKGYAVQKKAKKKVMADIAIVVCKKVRAFAASVNNKSLFGEMKISFSKLMYSASNLSLTYANNIMKAAQAMTAAERTTFEITDAELDELKGAIKVFNDIISIPRDRIVIRKTATTKMPDLFKTASGILTDEMDNLMSNFKESNPDFYSDYFNARIIVDLQRHTVLKGNVTDDAGIDLKKVKVTIKGKDKITNAQRTFFQEMTDKDGNYVKVELNPELDYDVTFELPEYEKVIFSDLDISRGEHEQLDVKMKKVAA